MENTVLLFTNFLVIALALFLALVVAASAANLHGQQAGDGAPSSEWRTTLGPDTYDADRPPVVGPQQPQALRVVVLGQPLRPEQEPQLVVDRRKRA